MAKGLQRWASLRVFRAKKLVKWDDAPLLSLHWGENSFAGIFDGFAEIESAQLSSCRSTCGLAASLLVMLPGCIS